MQLILDPLERLNLSPHTAHMKHFRSRHEAVREIKKRIRNPRRDMLLIVLVTGTAGFWISYALLLVGIEDMWVRYPLAVFIAYGVFIGMLRLWLKQFNRQPRESHVDVSGFDLIPDLSGSVASDPVPIHSFGGGGGFGGSGTGRTWEAASSGKVPRPSSSSKSGGGVDFSLDLDDALLIILPIVIVLSVLLIGLYMAPAILAEILLDGALMAGLYRQFTHVPTQHWIRTSIARTAWMFAVAAVLLGLAGFVIQLNYPHAVSFGVLWDTVIR